MVLIRASYEAYMGILTTHLKLSFTKWLQRALLERAQSVCLEATLEGGLLACQKRTLLKERSGHGSMQSQHALGTIA